MVLYSQDSFLDEVNFSGHILIFGVSGIENMFYLIAPLRRRTLKHFRPIVMVDRQLPSQAQWDAVSIFKGLYFFRV